MLLDALPNEQDANVAKACETIRAFEVKLRYRRVVLNEVLKYRDSGLQELRI